jgi:hypothetical protein
MTEEGHVKPSRAILLGGLTVGVLDGLDAVIFFGLRNGAAPYRIFQAIAAGLLGKASFQGGMATAALGLLLHLCIATTIVAVFVLASRRLPALARRPFLWGPLYGVAAYLVMNLVVVPLSAATPAHKALPVVINGVLIHIFGVGIPSALFARAAARPQIGTQPPLDPLEPGEEWAG